MEFVIGWLKLKPGMREEFMPLAKTHEAATRKEEGCLFYEWNPSASDENMMLLIEGWKTAGDHHAHQRAPHHLALVQAVGRYAVSGVFEEIEAARVVTQRPQFDG
jgi:quinol monooxygenase YgiN